LNCATPHAPHAGDRRRSGKHAQCGSLFVEFVNKVQDIGSKAITIELREEHLISNFFVEIMGIAQHFLQLNPNAAKRAPLLKRPERGRFF
jgi:hypothetical protein